MTTATKAAAETDEDEFNALILDLGKQKRRSVRKLRKGRGRLLDKISRHVLELKGAGEIAESAQPVIIIVREKKKKRDRWF